MRAGQLIHLARFESIVKLRDRAGQTKQSWAGEFETPCHIYHLRGGEQVIADRMVAKSPVILTVRKLPETDRIQASWRAVIDGAPYAIKERPQLTENRLFYQFLAVGGVKE